MLFSFVAFVLLFFGLISMVTPIPGGTFLIAISISILICSNAKAQAYMRLLRTKYDRFNRFIFWLELKVGSRVTFIGVALKKTHPVIEP